MDISVIIVLCILGLFPLSAQGQANGDLRLVSAYGTTGGSSGRLEIYYDGQWGTICWDYFGRNDGLVACKQLGFDEVVSYGRAESLSFLRGHSFQRIWLDNLAFRGTETRLADCSHRGFGVHNCNHQDDVGLVCQSSIITGQSSGDLRLVSVNGSIGGSSGRLEVYYRGQWGTVCEDYFGESDGLVACKQLGFKYVFNYGNVGSLGFLNSYSYEPIWLDNLACKGTETRLADCSHRGFGVHNCNHQNDVGLVCQSSNITVGSLRLQGGKNKYYGRLEVYYRGEWGTVCQDSFSQYETDVACRQLGFSRGYCWGSVGAFGIVAGSYNVPTWLDDLRCTSSDTSLINCHHRGVGVENCDHSKDVAVVCSNQYICNGLTTTTTTTRYRGGDNNNDRGNDNTSVYSGAGGGVTTVVVIVVIVIIICCCCGCCSSSDDSGSAPSPPKWVLVRVD